ncbi:YfhO family protein [Chitinophaga lutea]
MQQNWQKAVLPHVYAILLFLGLAFLFCSPVLQGMELQQSDNVSWKGMSHEAISYQEATGIKPLWTNAMFGGMPTYQIYMPQDNYTYWLHLAFMLGLPKPVNFFFLAMLGFYVLGCVMRFRPWVAVLGAVAYGFASYNAIIVSAGHDTKIISMAYMAPTLAGILLAYRGKYLAGGMLACVGFCLMITSGHYQVVYYMLLISLIIGIAKLVEAVKARTTNNFLKATGVLLVFGALSALPATVSIWTTSEYGKFTMRGGHSELSPVAGQESNKSAGGLDKDYAFQWSQGIGETFTTFVPNLYGGGSTSPLSDNSHYYKALTGLQVPAMQAAQIAENAPTYWGPQPMVDGGIYWGIAIMFLFIAGILIIRSGDKIWILICCALGIMLAWGDHFQAFNYLLFDTLPGYNKFRAPTQALVIPQFLVPFLACWALNDIVSGQLDKQRLLKNLRLAFYITAGIVAAILLASFVFMEFTSSTDPAIGNLQRMVGNNQDVVNQLVDALQLDRAKMLRMDALRSLLFVAAAFGVLWYFLKDKMKLQTALLALLAIVALDEMLLSHRYLNKHNYVTPSNYAAIFAPSEIDKAIKADPDPYYRVFDAANFQSAIGSYHHKMVGGYSPVKLALYQDLIEHQLSKGNPHVLNMLNAKYVIFPDQQGRGLQYQQNPGALGNAWFVDSLVWAKNADDEMKTLDSLPTDHAAVVDQRFKPQLEGVALYKDSASKVQLTQYGLNELRYRSSNRQAGLAVFSDIYYPAGWSAYIDGKKEDIVRVNYLLRGVKLPAGDHEIVMKFEPRSYEVGNVITRWASILILILFFAVLFFEWRRSGKQPTA